MGVSAYQAPLVPVVLLMHHEPSFHSKNAVVGPLQRLEILLLRAVVVERREREVRMQTG